MIVSFLPSIKLSTKFNYPETYISPLLFVRKHAFSMIILPENMYSRLKNNPDTVFPSNKTTQNTASLVIY